MNGIGTSCGFAHLDGVYVLGALAAGERAEYERHLPGCAACSRALRDLAGIPGLLGRLPADAAEQPPEPEPVPTTLLTAMVAEARRSRGRRRAATVSVVAAAVVLLVLVLAGIGASLRDDDPPSAAPAGSIAAPQRMESPETPSTGWVSLTARRWGTRIDLTCTYEGGLAGPTTYVLVVRSVDGRTQEVGSWRSTRGQEVRVTMATSLPADEIVSVEVRTESGYSVLRLAE
ncbi:zf-HC2 domain-containing protein [Nocardioides carbamazepini]|uniref:anti-sigma factor family protein n=1 Tax=Nocardioides carbamazepini TaxID=2854259 RepID=UPI00214A6506|nr:zf-HC2 domain-containing protein [Nocardioides carbamazepini]MCR1786597.1 zf-HC2 domain-containing protein [Nocardioides carbamazepini]